MIQLNQKHHFLNLHLSSLLWIWVLIEVLDLIPLCQKMDIIDKRKDFTREEKILLFNDLRNGYSELVKRLKDYGENQVNLTN